MIDAPSTFDVALETTSAPTPCEPPEVTLLHELEDCGARFPDPQAALAAIETAFDTAGDIRAAETLAWILARLPGGRRGDELKAALLGSVDGETVRETAQRNGVSHVTWWKSVERLRHRIFKGQHENG